MGPRENRPSLFWLLLSIIGLAVLFGWSIEENFGDRIRSIDKARPERDSNGRNLYLLIVDSLALDNVEKLPALQLLASQGFSAPVQPCVDNFTTACVREALSGRPVFSLFAMLENFQVIQSHIKHDLVHDSKNAGLKTALISRGDLRGWTKLVEKDIRAHSREKKGEEELRLGLAAAQNYHLVIHHWIWHDVASHRTKKGSKRYRKSLEKVDALIKDLDEGLPEHTDFMVMGDHGHTHDGRHIQGLDTPTFVAIRSPNLNPIQIKKRIPISAIRYLTGGVTGVGSHHAHLEPLWKEWFSPRVGAITREAGSTLQRSSAGLPLGPMMVAFIMGAVGCLILGWPIGLCVCIWSLFLGMSYPEWIQLTQFRVRRYNVMKISWLFPVMGALWGWLKWRSDEKMWRYAVLSSVGLFFVLWPGLLNNGVLRNQPAILGAVFIGLAISIWLRGHEKPKTTRYLWPVLLILAFALLYKLTGFSTNVFRIRKFPYQKDLQALHDFYPLIITLLSMGVHLCLDKKYRWSPVAALIAFVGLYANKYIHAAAFLSIVVLLIWGRGPLRLRGLSFLVLFASGYAFQPLRQIGILVTIMLFVLIFRAFGQLKAKGEDYQIAMNWGGALLLVATAQLALAWTIKLNVSGINFNFAIQWVEGTWHKKLWWLMAAATILSAFFPLLLIVEGVRHYLGAWARSLLSLASRLALLRFVATIIFTMLWVLRVGDSAPSIRLRSLLQDGFGWLIISIVLALLSLIPLYKKER